MHRTRIELWIALAAVGCTGAAVDSATDGETGEDTAVAGPVDDPTFQEHVQPVLDETCRGCHTSAFPTSGLVLQGDAWDDLVDVPSRQVDGMVRVAPDDPEASYLWHKLSGTHRAVGGTGDAMPPAPRELSEAHLETIRRWIVRGAPR